MNSQMLSSVTHLSDDALILRVKQLAAQERHTTATLIAHLAKFDARRLYLAEGYSSLFTYCTQVLHLSEHAAYGRIEAARVARRFPVILERLEEGSITLTTVCLLASHLTEENHRAVLDAACHLSKRQVEELMARLHPQPPVPASIRKLPTPRPSPVIASSADVSGDDITGHPAPTPRRSAIIAPLAPERYRVQFTATAEMHEKFRRAHALLRHQFPNGDPAAIFDRALTVLLEVLAKQKLGATDHPRDRSGGYRRDDVSPSRHIPAEVRRAVWERDGGQCAFVSPTGLRCTERGFLEFHHVIPFSAGGASSINNIQLRCRAHNGYEADLVFGRGKTQTTPREPRRPEMN